MPRSPPRLQPAARPPAERCNRSAGRATAVTRLAGESVASLGVPVPARPGSDAGLAAGSLATRGRIGDRCSRPSSDRRGSPRRGLASGAGGQRARDPEHVAPGLAQPLAMKGREHGVRVAGAGTDRAPGGRRRTPRVQPQLDAGVRQRRRHAVAAPRERATSTVKWTDRASSLARQRRELPLRRAMPDEQPAAAVAKRGVQVPEAFDQELRARPGAVAAPEQAVVEAEHRDHPVPPAVAAPAPGGRGGADRAAATATTRSRQQRPSTAARGSRRSAPGHDRQTAGGPVRRAGPRGSA